VGGGVREAGSYLPVIADVTAPRIVGGVALHNDVEIDGCPGMSTFTVVEVGIVITLSATD
jgi:hypothetical protein